MKKHFITFATVALLTLISLVPSYVSAQTFPQSVVGLVPCATYNSTDDPSPNVPSGLNCNSWQDLVGTIQFFINYAMIIAALLATLSFTYAGWLYLTSNGDGGQITRAHGIFLKVVKGFLFMALAYLLVRTILSGIAKTNYSLLE